MPARRDRGRTGSDAHHDRFRSRRTTTENRSRGTQARPGGHRGHAQPTPRGRRLRVAGGRWGAGGHPTVGTVFHVKHACAEPGAGRSDRASLGGAAGLLPRRTGSFPPRTRPAPPGPSTRRLGPPREVLPRRVLHRRRSALTSSVSPGFGHDSAARAGAGHGVVGSVPRGSAPWFRRPRVRRPWGSALPGSALRGSTTRGSAPRGSAAPGFGTPGFGTARSRTARASRIRSRSPTRSRSATRSPIPAAPAPAPAPASRRPGPTASTPTASTPTAPGSTHVTCLLNATRSRSSRCRVEQSRTPRPGRRSSCMRAQRRTTPEHHTPGRRTPGGVSDTAADRRHEPGAAAVPTPQQTPAPRHSHTEPQGHASVPCLRPPHSPESTTDPWRGAPSRAPNCRRLARGPTAATPGHASPDGMRTRGPQSRHRRNRTREHSDAEYVRRISPAAATDSPARLQVGARARASPGRARPLAHRRPTRGHAPSMFHVKPTLHVKRPYRSTRGPGHASNRRSTAPPGAAPLAPWAHGRGRPDHHPVPAPPDPVIAAP